MRISDWRSDVCSSDLADVDGELVVALEELAGAVERVDQPEPPADARRALAGGALLFRDHRDLRRPRPQHRHDRRLRRRSEERRGGKDCVSTFYYPWPRDQYKNKPHTPTPNLST